MGYIALITLGQRHILPKIKTNDVNDSVKGAIRNVFY